MDIILPSRYEQIELEFRGRLRPNRFLIETVQAAVKSCKISGGVRFIPVFGRSGCGKTSAALELGTHIPDLNVHVLTREEIVSRENIASRVEQMMRIDRHKIPVLIVDQYEESVAEKEEDIPSQFIEAISLLDREELKNVPTVFLWLTTSPNFQKQLADAASRNERVLHSRDFELIGPEQDEWPAIIDELFEFHNEGVQLADFQVLEPDLFIFSSMSPTIGHAIATTADKLSDSVEPLHDLSNYTIYMLWPVTDGTRLQRIQQFTEPRQGYRLNWNAWYRQVSPAGTNIAYTELNKARLYFDLRLVPIQVADLHMLCRNLDETEPNLGASYLDQFRRTHFYSIVSGVWNPDTYSPLRERPDSKRAEDAREWYLENTTNPTKLGRRLAYILRQCGYDSDYEQDIESPYGKVRADVFISDRDTLPENVIVELKAFSAENTMPSTICEQVRITMRRHAELLGMLKK